MDEKIAALKDQIRKESHDVRILEAQLDVAREKTKRKRLLGQITQSHFNNRIDPSDKSQRKKNAITDASDTSTQDLLDVLNALGSRNSGTNCKITLSTGSTEVNLDNEKWQEDSVSFRLLPLLGGVCFTFISHPTKKSIDAHHNNGSDLKQATKEVIQYDYDLKGYVLIGKYTFHLRMSVNTSRSKDAKLKLIQENAKVEKLDIQFDLKKEAKAEGWLFPHDELTELSSIARKTKNVTQMFRNIVTFSEFDLQRGAAMKRFIQTTNDSSSHQICFQRRSAHMFRLISRLSNNFMELDWKFLFSLFGRGVEELALVEVSKRSPDGSRAIEVINNEGLQALIDFHGGSCDKAINELIASISSNDTDSLSND